jgi:mono/diheme cytochrome c family protein
VSGKALGTARVVVLVAATVAATGCEWFTDFKQQPKIKPWQWEYAGDTVTPMRGSPMYSVPLTGNPEPAYVVSYQQLPGTIDSMSNLQNPHAPTPASLDNGRKYFQINCAVCHGIGGGGNGTAVQFGVPAPSLLSDVTKNRTDGYIYGMIRNGRGLMPTYDRIEDMDRWDVVNYVRGLQGRLDRQVPLGPLGYPGQGGYTVPGHSVVGPTRPVYHNVSQYTDSALARQVRGIPGSTAAPLPAEHGGTP